MRCRASAPIVGAVDADQSVALNVTAPKYVQQGSSYDVVTLSGDTEVPFEASGITLISLRDIITRTRFSGGFTIQSAALVAGTGSWRSTPTAAPAAIPGGVNVTIETGNTVRMHMVGPFLPGGILTPPSLKTTVLATGAPGTTISSQFAGTIPANLAPPFADFGFSITPRVNAPIVGETDAQASCAPNYGPLANGNGELTGTVPHLTDTTILPDTKPLVTITTPLDGAKYLPDAEIFADYECTETVYALVSCEATTPDGEQLDFSTFGVKDFTVTATDANGSVTSKTVTYEVGGNVTPEVSAGTDQTVNGGQTVTLHGSATDPDTGQVLSYNWTQISGPPIVFNPDDSSDPFEPNWRFVAPRGGPHTLQFRLRVDDGFDTGEDTVTVFVNANNAPTFTNGPAQTINNIKTGATVLMNGVATDAEGDTPITYQWTQLDDEEEVVAPEDPDHVTLTGTTAPGAGFQAPEGPTTLHFRVTATDSLGAIATGTVTVNVLANQAPVITAGNSQTLTRKILQSVQLNGTATDPDNNAPSANQVLTYAWTQVDENGDAVVPPTVTLSSSTVAQPTFTAPADPGTLRFRVAVSDGYDTTIGTVVVTILASDPPVANAGPDQTPGRGKLVTLDGSGSSDPDADPITYAWTQVDALGAPVPAEDPLHVTLSDATAQKPTFTAPVITGAPQAIVFRLVVTDSHSLASTPDTVTINLLENQAPVANAGAAQTNKFANTAVSLSGAASTDIDQGDTLTYAWTQVDDSDVPIPVGDPRRVTLNNAATVTASFTAPHVATSTTLRFRLVVTDTFSAASAPAFTTVQINANRAPTLAAPSATPSSRPIGTVTTIQVAAPANDADGDPAAGYTYQWVQTNSGGTPCAPSCAVANVTINTANQRVATFTAPAFNVASATLFFRLTVNDGFGATVQSSNLTVALANTNPTVQFAIRPKQMAATNSITNATTVNLIYTGQQVELDGTAAPAGTPVTSDADGNALTYQWRQVTTFTTATGTLVNCATVTCVFGGANTSTASKPVITMPANGGGANNRTFLQLVVTDEFGGSPTRTAFNLNPLANTAPTVGTSGPTFVTVGASAVALTGTATDPQTTATPAQTLTFQWTQVDGSGNPVTAGDPLFAALTGATTLTPTFNAPSTPGTIRFRLSVTDGAATVTSTRTIEVIPENNQAPTANAGPDQSGVKAGQTVTLDGSGSSDPENHTFTYAWTQVNASGDPVAPATVTLSSATAQKPTFTAPGNGPVTVHFRLVVTDQYAAVSTPDFVDISVDANGAPIANAGPDQSDINAGVVVTLDGSGSTDPENHTITYAWTQVDASGDPVVPATVTLSSATAQKPTFTAPSGNGVLHFRLVVTDQFGLASAPDVVDIDLTNNQAPTANAGPDQTGVKAGQTVTLDGSGSSDPENHTITYAWTQVDGSGDPVVPATVTLSSATAQKPTFAAPANGPITLRFRLVVTDQFGDASGPDIVEIAVDANATPTANAGSDQSGIKAGQTVTLDGSGSTDPENHTITYAWTQVDASGDPVAPPTVTLSSATAQKPTFSAPATGPVTLRFRLVVTDQFGAVSAADIVEIAVDANAVPLANAGPNQTGIIQGATVTLNGAGSSDPENHTITYAWTQVDNAGTPVAPPTVTLSSATAQKPTFTAPSAPTGLTLRFRLVVTDQFGAVSAPSFTFVSVGSNRRPVANAGPDQTPGRGKVVTLDGSGSSDPDGDAITYSWVQMAGFSPILPDDPLAVTLSSSTAQKPTFTAPVAVGVLTFWLFVTDSHGTLSDPDIVAINLVANTNPVANAGAAQTNKATNSTVTLTGAASTDLDSDPLTYAWTQVDDTDTPIAVGNPLRVNLSSANAISPTFVAPHFATSTTLRFQLVVTDSLSGVSAPAFTTVQVNANRAPTLGTPTVSAAATRAVGQTATIQIPAPANDADADPATGFTYQWVQTNTGGTPCAPGCAVKDVTINNANQRIATFVAPPFNVAGATLFFRLTVTDGFGATVQSSNLTVALTNSAPVSPNPPTLRTGVGLSVVNPANIYIGAGMELDATATTDPDGTSQFTYEWSGQPCGGLGESLGCLFASGASGWPGGSCRGITFTPDAVVPGKATFTGPPFGPSDRNPNVCGLRLVVTDPFGATVTRNWSYGLKANVGGPTSVINALPAKVLATTPAANGIIALSGAATTDPDTNPAQPLGFTWEQVDPVTGAPLPANAPSRGVIANPNSINTTWKAPSTAPHTVRFALTSTDGITFPNTALSTPVSVTTQAPGANAGPDRLTKPSQQVTLDGTGSFDAGGRALTYSWKQTAGPSVGTLQTPLTATARFNAPHIPFDGATQIYTFELTTRNGLAASFDTVTVVNEPWGRAVAAAGTDATVNSNVSVQLDGSGSSTPSPAPLTYQWTQTAGAPVTLSSATAQKPTFTSPTVPQDEGQRVLTFSLVANDGFGASEADSVTITVNPVLEVPRAPTITNIAPGNATATLQFTAGFNGGSPVLLYIASCTSTTGGVAKSVFGGAPTIVVSGLTNGALYTCKVAGVNAVGVGAFSAASSQIRPSAPPAVPTNVTAVTGNGNAVVNWTPGANGGEPFVLYGTNCTSMNGGVARSALTGAGPITVANLTNGATYTCTVVAAHALGTSPTSAPSPAFVVGAPAAPAAPTVVNGSGQATVSWIAPANNGAAIASYTVTPFIGAVAQAPRSTGGAATSLIVTGLTNSQTYTFKVSAVNARGTGVASPASIAVLIGAPNAPTGVTAAVLGLGRARVSWTSAVNNGSNVTSYIVTPIKNGVAEAPRVLGTATIQNITGLTVGASYTFRVQATNARGTSPASALSNAVTIT